MSPRSGENVPVTSHPSRHTRSRRSHGKILAPLADSSEDEPSPHSSIFEAVLASDSENESPQGKSGSEVVAVAGRNLAIAPRGNRGSGRDEGSSTIRGGDPDMNSMLEAEMTGSPDHRRSPQPSQGLETIVEQKSTNTLEVEESQFPRLDRRSSSEFSDDDEEESLLPRGRRKMIPGRKVSSGSDYFDYYDVDEVYDYVSPTQPLYQSVSALNNTNSPVSPATPLGGTPPISASFFNRNYSPSSPIRTPLQGPTFRPPTSGYRSYGTLTNHPFHNAPLARSDRGEGSSRVDSSEGRAATPDSLRSVRQGRSRPGSVSDAIGRGATRRWKWTQLCGIFCCLGRREDEG